jgi:hypothetical protein
VEPFAEPGPYIRYPNGLVLYGNRSLWSSLRRTICDLVPLGTELPSPPAMARRRSTLGFEFSYQSSLALTAESGSLEELIDQLQQPIRPKLLYQAGATTCW